jgi:hypothetical protein
MNFVQDVSPLGSLSLDRVVGPSTAHELVSHEPRPTSRDRNGLIERIKRVKSPLWQFRQDVSSYWVTQAPICIRKMSSLEHQS